MKCTIIIWRSWVRTWLERTWGALYVCPSRTWKQKLYCESAVWMSCLCHCIIIMVKLVLFHFFNWFWIGFSVSVCLPVSACLSVCLTFSLSLSLSLSCFSISVAPFIAGWIQQLKGTKVLQEESMHFEECEHLHSYIRANQDEMWR